MYNFIQYILENEKIIPGKSPLENTDNWVKEEAVV